MERYHLKLFITGKTPRSLRAIDNLERICHNQLGEACRLEVIDVLEAPERAEEARILATPTVIRELPRPLRRIIGDLSDTRMVLQGLELQPMDGPPD
ncbi:MAG: circadian clock KaiB family protein [Gemmataceae bacterium]